MTVFILALLTTLQIQSYDLGDEYYLLLDTGATTVSFSSFRLNEPERIVLEVGGAAAGAATPAVGATVGRIERDDLGDKTRFVFHISPGSAYTILHRKNLLLIGFRQELFITDETIETTLAAIDTRLAEKKAALAAAEAERLAAEQAKLAAEAEAKRLAEAKAAPQPEKKLAAVVPAKSATEEEDALIGMLAAEQSRKQAQEEAVRLAALEKERLEKEALARAAEQARIAKAEEERKLAEAKRLDEQRRADEQLRLAKTAAEKRRAEAEQKRLAEEKRLAAEAEAKRLAELKAAEDARLAALKKAEEEKRLAETKAAEDARLAALKKAEEEKQLALAKAAEPQKVEEPPLSPEEKMKSLKVVKLEPTRKITEEAPPLKVVTLAAKGKLRNLFFRKFPEFSRVTMEVTGELDYAFREVKGGYVIDIHNFEKIPNYLLHIIDTRAFNAEVQYIYPKKDGRIFKIYIKSEQNIAVRKSEEDGLIHFDFYVPTMQ